MDGPPQAGEPTMNVQQQANSLEEYWLPFTPNRHFKENPRLLSKAAGMYFWNHRGEKVLDGVSSLFCCNLGHGRREIADAVYAAMQEIDFAPPFQFASPLAFDLAREVAAITPGDLDRVFFVNSGSEAVETAIKIALVYHRANGQPQRQRLIGRERAYHGVNIGGMSLGGMVKNREAHGLGLPGVAHLRHTWTPEGRFSRGQPAAGAELADDLQRFVELHGADTIAACFVEPIAGSTGILVPPVGYLERLRAICDAHGILLVFDEVICGFGRTGAAFGADSFGVTPDIMTMAKGLTNAAVPMGAVAVRADIYDTINAATPGAGVVEFFHGYTYSAHPAACAAGLAALKIYRDEDIFAKGAALSPYFLDRLFALRDLDAVTDIRGYGLLGAVDLAPHGAPGARGYDVLQRLFEAGVMLRIIGDTVVFAPPLVAEQHHIDQLCDTLRNVLEAL
jgi:beta-alanine--pyruvate transaminase